MEYSEYNWRATTASSLIIPGSIVPRLGSVTHSMVLSTSPFTVMVKVFNTTMVLVDILSCLVAATVNE